VEHRDDRFTAIEYRYANYTVYDREGDKIGKVDDIFVDETDQPEYIGVKMGFLGLSSTLIPWQLCRIDEGDHRIEISAERIRPRTGLPSTTTRRSRRISKSGYAATTGFRRPGPAPSVGHTARIMTPRRARAMGRASVRLAQA
jgi:sporulation protein YlmC with PRC-barrel domain